MSLGYIPGGGVTIESTDESVTVTHPRGPVVDLSVAPPATPTPPIVAVWLATDGVLVAAGGGFSTVTPPPDQANPNAAAGVADAAAAAAYFTANTVNSTGITVHRSGIYSVWAAISTSGGAGVLRAKLAIDSELDSPMGGYDTAAYGSTADSGVNHLSVGPTPPFPIAAGQQLLPAIELAATGADVQVGTVAYYIAYLGPWAGTGYTDNGPV